MTDNIKQQKQTAREQARLHRDRLDVDQTEFETVIDIFLTEIQPKKDQIISAYWPAGKEFDCRFLLDELSTQGYQCALPRTIAGQRELEFVQWSHDTKMKKGAFGILEPEEGETVKPDIVLAPLLAFDQKGYRLGQGGGYYDSTLAALRKEKEVIYIGVGYAEQAVLLKLPREEHDIRLDYILTPQGVTDFGDRD